MSVELRNNKDVWSGAMLIAIGAGAIIIARDYPFGSTLRMGAGYFPIVLGGLLIAFGLIVLAQGLRSPERIAGGWSLRTLVILPLSLVAFGLLIDRAGFLPALVVLIVGAAAAGREFRIGEVAALTLVLTALATLVFIYGLGLPYPLIFGF